MSTFNFSNAHQTRNRLLTSAAVFTLIASGAIGDAVLTKSSANAAAVAMSDIQNPAAPSFAAMIERVRPAVVSIKVRMKNAADQSGDDENQWQNLPPSVRRFFKQFGYENGMPQLKPQPMVGEGSGFFVSSDGYIVTNNHVVDDAKTVTVTTNDGKILGAKVVGVDPRSDLAVLKVIEKGDYPYVAFAKEEPKIGDWVVAIGNPYGLGGTATAGIVSAKGRDLASDPYDEFMQIDAPINRGNSGGPTFNTQGQVVGVNTAIVSPSGGSVGIGFAIPADTVEPVVDALEHGGVVTRGYLGVKIQQVTPDIAESLGLKKAAGALVAQTESGTPAAAAGVKSGDVITNVDGQPVADTMDLTHRIASLKPGEKVDLSIWRDGAEMTITATLSKQESLHVAKASATSTNVPDFLGVELAPASEVAGAGDRGVAIVAVDPDGVAAEKGLKEGDVILKVSGKPVSAPQEVKQDIDAVKHDGKKAVLLEVRTSAGDRYVAFAFPHVG